MLLAEYGVFVGGAIPIRLGYVAEIGNLYDTVLKQQVEN